ncbi:GNAT family N-acetyltransferase [Cysteiniphilum sp. JM-1]|uniref:GNAT family N-acetyltransferase n=1 Tax=Cysteiniphilum sp. JM-1 TaxID=2610891 RepID=UPI00168D5393|nr:GNAT family N-acetyltransferase [Cysteiniphilum sp. JM-1]
MNSNSISHQQILSMQLLDKPKVKHVIEGVKLMSLDNQAPSLNLASTYAAAFKQPVEQAWTTLYDLAYDKNIDVVALINDQDNVIGVCSIKHNEDAIWLNDFLIYPRCQRQGYAQYFIKLIFEQYIQADHEVKKIKLNVRKTNNAAICLYSKVGFVKID